jgi:hypothetical protein
MSWASQACERERGSMNAIAARLLVGASPGSGAVCEVKMVVAESCVRRLLREVNVKCIADSQQRII